MGDGQRAPGGELTLKNSYGYFMFSNSETQFSLINKVAVITGASGDLGLAMADALGKAGAKLVLASRYQEKLDKTVEILNIDKSRILTKVTDVTDIRQVEGLMGIALNAFNRLDILVTAAGTQVRKPALEVTQEEWEYVIRVNLTGTFFCCKAAAQHMIPQGKGKIILVSSLTSEIGIPNIVPYVASKGAIRQLSKALAVEWAKFGINVNCIGPGRFVTNMTKDIFSNEKVKESFLKLIPMGRPGVPSDLTGITVFLASEASNYITGQSFYVDGGWLAAGGNPSG